VTRSFSRRTLLRAVLTVHVSWLSETRQFSRAAGDKELVKVTFKAAGWWMSGYIMHQKSIRKVDLLFVLQHMEQTDSGIFF